MTTTRRRLSATATLLLVPTLAACGFGAQTNHQYQSAAGSDSIQAKDAAGNLVNAASPIQVYNAAIVADTNNPSGVFVGTFVNNTAPDPAQGYNATTGTLTDPGVTATVQSMQITNPSQASTPVNLTLPTNTSYKPQPFGCGTGNYGLKVTLPASLVQGDTLTKGEYVTMAFSIVAGSSAPQTVTMQVPVFPSDGAGGIYSGFYQNDGAAPAGECPSQSSVPAASAIATPATPIVMTPSSTATP